MRRVPQGQGDYEMFPEGVDNDLDGRYNEDGIGGLDLHRNYPENWRPMREATGRGLHAGRRRRVPAVGARNPRGLPVPDDASRTWASPSRSTRRCR